MEFHVWLTCAATLVIAGCADSHDPPPPFTVPDARPACVRMGGSGESVNYYLTQSSEDGAACVLGLFSTQPAARPSDRPFSVFSEINGPANYFLSVTDRLSMPCNRARLEPYPGTTNATAGSGTIAVQRVGGDPFYAILLVTASLDLAFPAAPDGSLPASTEHVRALDVDPRAPVSDECMQLGP